MLNGLPVAESLRLDTELCVESLSVTRVKRRDMSPSATARQPSVYAGFWAGAYRGPDREQSRTTRGIHAEAAVR